MRKIVAKRKSSFDVDNATNIISGVVFTAILLSVLLLVIAIIFGLSIWGGTNGSANLTTNITTIQNNILGLVINFFALMPTVGTILAVVILIGVIVLLVLYVKRMASTGSQPTAFQG